MDSVRETEAEYIDKLYNLRQDGKLTDEHLAIFLKEGAIRQWTYERLLSLKPEGKAE